MLEKIKRIRADARILKFLISGFACLQKQNHIPAKARSAFTPAKKRSPAHARLVAARAHRRDVIPAKQSYLQRADLC